MPLDIDQVAEALETDPRTARRFLRSVSPEHDYRHKWLINEDDMEMLRLLFIVREVGLKKALDALTEARQKG